MGQRASTSHTSHWSAGHLEFKGNEVQRLCQKYGLKELQSFLSASSTIKYKALARDISKHQDPATFHTCCQFIIYYSKDHPRWKTLSKQYCTIARILLMKMNVDASVRDSFQKTALHYLVRSVHSPAVETLAVDMLQKGIDINDSDYRGRTALHLSNFKNNTDTINISWDTFLIKNGASVNKTETQTHKIPIEKIKKALGFVGWHRLVLIHLKGGLNLAHLPSSVLNQILTKAIEEMNLELVLALADAGGKIQVENEQMLMDWKLHKRLDLSELSDRILSLKRLAGNVVRVSLWPNAIVGVEGLGIPKLLQDYVILDRFR